MEDYFLQHGCRGIAIDKITEILMLGFADDYVLLADSPMELSKKLNALHSYCAVNKLIVNTEKTKIIIFTKSGNSKAKNSSHLNTGTTK